MQESGRASTFLGVGCNIRIHTESVSWPEHGHKAIALAGVGCKFANLNQALERTLGTVCMTA